MKQTALGLLVLIMAMTATLTGCVVSQSTHELTLQDLQAAKSDLDRLRVQNEALNKQVKILQEAKAKLREDLDKANSEVAALNASGGRDRQALENKLKDLERQVKELAAARRTLAQEIEVQKQKYESAQKTIKRQQKELKEREQSELLPTPTPAKPGAPAAMDTPKAPTTATPNSTTPPATPAAPKSPPAPTAPVVDAAKAVPAPPPGPLVDINKSSEADLVLTLGLGKEESQKLIKNRPYKTKDELLTKAALPKATVDRIKDKIIVAP